MSKGTLTLAPSEATDPFGDEKTDPIVNSDNEHFDDAFPASSAAAPAVPLDDHTFFSQLMAIAENAGRPELADECRRRAEESAISRNGDAAASVKKPPTSAAVTKLLNQGLRLIRDNKPAEAIEKLREAARLAPREHAAHGNLGVALARLGRVAEAETAFREAIRLRPEAANMRVNLGTAYLQQGKWAEAEEQFREALRAQPNSADTHRLLGRALEGLKQPEQAEAEFRAALTLKPDSHECHHHLGKVLEAAKRFPEAEACCREAMRLKPDRSIYWKSLALVLEAQGQSAGAEAAYRVAIGLNPKDAEAHANLGVSLGAQNRMMEAEAAYRQALALAPQLATAHNNLGNCLQAQGRFDEAVASLREAIRLVPHYAEAHNNLGIVFILMDRSAEALACYDEALRLRPDYPEAHLNRSLHRLSVGDFENGWPEYEWRFRMKNRQLPGNLPRWDGTPLDGRRLLLQSEQGLGDTVQFMRYAALVPRGSGGTVGIDCQPPLADLARTCSGIDRVLASGEQQSDFDVCMPMLSIGAALGTTLDNIPGEVPYISAAPERVGWWRKKIEPIPGVRVGIAWQGSPDHKLDRQRSVSLAQFAAVAKVPGVSLCSMQRGFGAEQLTDGTADDFQVHNLSALIGANFADTAALIGALDLVITVDTAVAHVAGALGKPVWVLLPFTADWRWLIDREDSPWYPTMRLFRQSKAGDWTGLFERVAFDLQRSRESFLSDRVRSG